MEFSEWLFDHVSHLIVGAIIIIILLAIVAAVKGDADAKAEFMEECTQHYEKFECTALWRDGDTRRSAPPIVIPMPRS